MDDSLFYFLFFWITQTPPRFNFYSTDLRSIASYIVSAVFPVVFRSLDFYRLPSIHHFLLIGNPCIYHCRRSKTDVIHSFSSIISRCYIQWPLIISIIRTFSRELCPKCYRRARRQKYHWLLFTNCRCSFPMNTFSRRLPFKKYMGTFKSNIVSQIKQL